MIEYYPVNVTEEILDEIADLARSNHEETSLPGLPFFFDRERYLAANDLGLLTLVVAVDKGEIVGFINVIDHQDPHSKDAKYSLEEGFYVKPQYRSQGVGSSLLKALEDVLEDKGHTTALVLAVPVESAILEEAGFSINKYVYIKRLKQCV